MNAAVENLKKQWSAGGAATESGRAMAPAPVNSGGTGGSMPLVLYIRPLLQKWWLIGPLAVFGGAIGLAYSSYVEPLYRATCRYEIFENTMLRITDQGTSHFTPYYMYTANPMDQHIIRIRSRNLNERVGKRLLKKWGRDGAALEISPVEKAPHALVDISVTSFNPDYSVDYITALMEEYQAFRRESIAAEHQDTLYSLRAHETQLQSELTAAREELIRFEDKHNVVFEERLRQTDLELVNDLLVKRKTIMAERAILASQLQALDGANATTLQDVYDFRFAVGDDNERGASAPSARGPGWSELSEWESNEAALRELRATYKRLRAVYKPDHPKMLALHEEIEIAETRRNDIADLKRQRLSDRLAALTLEETTLQEEAKRIKAAIALTSMDRAEHEKLKANVEQLKTFLENIHTRILDADHDARERWVYRLIERPLASDVPVYPNKAQMVGKGIAMGGGFGIALVYLMFFRAMRLYNLELIEEVFGLSPVGSVPRVLDPEVCRNPLALSKLHKADPTCEVYRSIRTTVEERLGDGNVVLFTSPDQGDGKTFTSANTAIAWSWTEKRIIMVEGDIRKPSLQKILGHRGKRGLTDCLADDTVKWRDCVIPIADHLDLLPSGHASGDGAELLQIGRSEELFDELRHEYDVVLIDSAPINRVVDTQLLSRLADAVVLVTRPGKTSVAGVRHAMQRLSSANVVGYIANCVTSANQWYYSEHGSQGYYYRGYRDYYYYGEKADSDHADTDA